MPERETSLTYLPGTFARLTPAEQVKALGGTFKQTEFLAAAILAHGPIRLSADEMHRGRQRNKDLALRYIHSERVWESYLKGESNG